MSKQTKQNEATMTEAIKPKKGMRFEHRRVLNPAYMPEKVPALFEVTSVRGEWVYYALVVQRKDDAGNVYREDLGKAKDFYLRADFGKICLRVVDKPVMPMVIESEGESDSYQQFKRGTNERWR